MRILFKVTTTILTMLVCVSTTSAANQAPSASLSLEGMSGVLNIPNARVSDEGDIQLLYSNQRESMWRNKVRRQDNYLLNMGLFNFMELGGRLTEAPSAGTGTGGIRDLSANVKLTTAPLTRDRPLWPTLAVGIQDVGGGANLLESRYVVASEDIWRFRLSAGYGFGPSRMKGGFAGGEFRLHDWVTLLGEYDTADTNVGLRVQTPELWRTPVHLDLTVKATVSPRPDRVDLAFGVHFPLDFRKKTPGYDGCADAAEEASTVFPPGLEGLEVLQDRLKQAGLFDVRVGEDESELVIEYENILFNHNELDALGVVAGIAAESAPSSFERLRIIIKRKGIRVAALTVPIASYRDFLAQPDKVEDLKNALKFSSDIADGGAVTFLPEEPSWRLPHTALILAPGLTTFVGTEVGVFDYLLSLKPEVISNLWPGGVVDARWDIPVSWSDNFDEGKPFRSSRYVSRMDRLMLFQGVQVMSGLKANLGAGMILHDNYGVLNEAVWSPGDGTHRLRMVQGWSRDGVSDHNLTVYLGSYRYYLAQLDLFLGATAGRFWGQDQGFSTELKRFFGDTAVSAFYKNTTTREGKHWQAAGIQFSFPLTFRKDLHLGPVVVRGPDEWGYAQETTLAVGGQKSNDVVSQSLAIDPEPAPSLRHAYDNRDRLNAEYVRAHLKRLRDAWQCFGKMQKVDPAN